MANDKNNATNAETSEEGESCNNKITNDTNSLRSQNKKDDNNNALPLVTWEELSKHNSVNDLWFAIDDKVYDVSDFVNKHPGGRKVLLSLAGLDATHNFWQNHDHNLEPVMKYMKLYEVGRIKRIPDALMKDFDELNERLHKEGWFKTDPLYYAWKIFLCFLILVLSIYLLLKGGPTLGTEYPSYWNDLFGILGSIAFGLYLQQTAFIGHDLGHNSVSHSIFWDSVMGLIFGNLTGISLSWWKHTHNVHHIRTNDLNFDPDIQHLPVMAISERFLHSSFFSQFHDRSFVFDRLAQFFVSFQTWLHLPLILNSRWNLYVQSIIHVAKHRFQYEWLRVLEMIFMGLYFVGLYHLFNMTNRPWTFRMFSHACSGILNIQIVANHFPMPVFDEMDDNFFIHQVKTSMAIESTPYTDWFHGGLQFQVEHHLFPQMPRHNLRKVQPLIRELCDKHGLTYYEDSLAGAVGQIWGVMRDVSDVSIHYH